MLHGNKAQGFATSLQGAIGGATSGYSGNAGCCTHNLYRRIVDNQISLDSQSNPVLDPLLQQPFDTLFLLSGEPDLAQELTQELSETSIASGHETKQVLILFCSAISSKTQRHVVDCYFVTCNNFAVDSGALTSSPVTASGSGVNGIAVPLVKAITAFGCEISMWISRNYRCRIILRSSPVFVGWRRQIAAKRLRCAVGSFIAGRLIAFNGLNQSA